VVAVIDDRLLLDVLAGKAPPRIAGALSGGGLFTVSLWFYRLGTAYAASADDLRLSDTEQAFHL
jgi:hypothetical protein